MSTNFASKCLLGLGLITVGCEALITTAPYFYNKERPLVVGHRGSLGHFPEHSLGSYTDAYHTGVDFVELDLQVTKDGYLVTNHDPCLRNSTNIDQYESLFGDRRTDVTVPNFNHYTDDYLINDFTLAELKMLKRKQRYDTRNPYMNGAFQILTLEETIEHMVHLRENYPRSINSEVEAGLYIEIKEYSFYQGRGIDAAKLLFDVLETYEVNSIIGAIQNQLPIVIQSFEEVALLAFREWSDLPLVMLCDWVEKGVTYDWEWIATFAHGLGPDSKWIMYYPHVTQVDFDPTTYSPFMEYMHSLNIGVHPWTLKDDILYYMDTPQAETELYITKGVDGIFTEFPGATYDQFDRLGTKANFPSDEAIKAATAALSEVVLK